MDLELNVTDEKQRRNNEALRSAADTNSSEIVTAQGEIVTAQADILWLKNNFKTYEAGQTYNGVALTVSGVNTCHYGVFRPFRTIRGTIEKFFLELLITFNLPAPAANCSPTIAGVTFLNIASGYIPIGVHGDGGAAYFFARVTPNTGTIYCACAGGGGVMSDWRLQGIAQMETWPTWADTIT